jgi:AcrR family transcriptional regulator
MTATDRVGPRRRGRPPASDSEATRARILASARRAFGREGYARASMEQIAEQADVTPRALYHYVDSKEQLFALAAAEAYERLGLAVLEHVAGKEHTRDRMKGFLEAYRSLYVDDPSLVSFVSAAIMEANRNPELPSPLAGDGPGDPLAVFVDDAIRRAELDPSVDATAARTLLEMFGAGMTLIAGSDREIDYAGMLDALELLIDGELFT